MPLLRIAIANNARKSEYTFIIKGSYLMYTSHLRCRNLLNIPIRLLKSHHAFEQLYFTNIMFAKLVSGLSRIFSFGLRQSEIQKGYEVAVFSK